MGKMKEMGMDIQQAAYESDIRSTRWFRSGRQPLDDSSSVVESKGLILGISVVTAGEAKGHEVWLDKSFVADVVRMGNENPQGIKARFGHPTMSAEALGTYLGQFTNFRLSKDGTQALADLQLNEASRQSPHGDLWQWVLTMAKTAPKQLGASIVFSVGAEYYHDLEGNHIETAAKGKTEVDANGNPKRFVQIRALYGTDIVDEPAANGAGLFSAVMNPQAFAVQLTQFLDDNAALSDWLLKDPDNAINKLRAFLKRYAAYRAKITEPMPTFSIDCLLSAADGNKIRVFTDSDTPAIGDIVAIARTDGSEDTATDGDYALSDGSVIVVKNSKITAINAAPDEDTGGNDDGDMALLKADNDRLKTELCKIRDICTNLSARIKALESDAAADHSRRSPVADGNDNEFKKLLSEAPHNRVADYR